MNRSVSGLVALGVLVSVAAQAQVRCTVPEDQAAFEVGALKSEMTVLATSCPGADKEYNVFIERFRPQLVSSDAAVNGWFKRTYGRNAQRQYDAYITLLINSQSQSGLQQGTNFCPRTEVVFSEVMGLHDGASLPQYAAGKDVLPSDVGACEEPKAIVVKARGRKIATKHK